MSILTLAEALARRRHQIGIIEIVANGAFRKQSRASGVEVWSIPKVVRTGDYLHRSSVSRATRQFQSVVSQFKPHVVAIQTVRWQSIPVIATCALPHKWSLVVTVREQFPSVGEEGLKPWQDRLFNQADFVTTVSNYVWKGVLQEYPFVQKKGKVIYNGMDQLSSENVSRIEKSTRERYVLYAGRFHKQKGVDVLLRAWKLTQRREPQALLWLAGEGEELNNLKLLSEELGITSSVRFLGVVPHNHIFQLYRRAEIVVIPSRSEGFPRVALEAGACGAICIGSRIGGILEVILDNITGFLVEPESPEDLAHVLQHALHLTSENRERITKAAKRKIRECFSQDRTVMNYEELFRSLRHKAKGYIRSNRAFGLPTSSCPCADDDL